MVNRWRLALALCALCVGTAAHAGPPFLTDDPAPVELHHTEINLALQKSRAAAGSSGTLGADINYGCAEETQCHFAVPGAFSHAVGDRLQAGLGDIELGVKYRFFNDEGSGVMAAVYPTLYLPTGDAARSLGNGRAQVLLPLWVQQTSGPWIWDAGAAHLSNPAAGARNSWFFGLLGSRSFGDGLRIGAELVHRTPVSDDGLATTGFNVGAIVKLACGGNLLVSVGRGLQGVSANRGSEYIAYQVEL